MRRGSAAIPGFLRRFLATEAAGGAVLVMAAVLALAWANSPWWAGYFRTADRARFTVNDVLMAGFFFVIGLEVKREIVNGELRQWRVAAAPVLAAAGGMLLPALIYLAVSHGAAAPASKGWGIPMATDIAFTIGVLTLLGPRIPNGLRIFVLTLAVADDIGAVAILAIVSWKSVGLGDVALIAAVVAGLLVPAGAWAERLETGIHPWVAFAVLPLFALANTGVRFADDALRASGSTKVLVAIVAARLLGKAVGITVFAWLATRLGFGSLPSGVALKHVLGASIVAAVGFTVPLYFTEVAFDASPLQAAARVGLLAASVVGFAIGVVALLAAGPGEASEEAGGGPGGLPLPS